MMGVILSLSKSPYFQNFSQLADFIGGLGLSFDIEIDRTLITREALVELLNELEPIINVIKHFTWEQICYYDEWVCQMIYLKLKSQH